MAKIILEDMEFYAYHGCYPEERKIGNTYLVTVTLDMNLDSATCSDELESTIDYERVYNLVRTEMQEPSNLIEHVAYRIKSAIHEAYSKAEHITVKVSKLAPPLGGKVARASVIV